MRRAAAAGATRALRNMDVAHFCHSDGTIGRVVNARKRNGGGGWEAMIVWYNADGTVEPMSEGDEECTSDGTLRWHKEGQDLCVRNRFVPDP